MSLIPLRYRIADAIDRTTWSYKLASIVVTPPVADFREEASEDQPIHVVTDDSCIIKIFVSDPSGRIPVQIEGDITDNTLYTAQNILNIVKGFRMPEAVENQSDE